MAIFLGLLAFAGSQAINAVFALSVTGLYFAYAVPIVVRFTGDNDFKPGPFHLGIFFFFFFFFFWWSTWMHDNQQSWLRSSA
jgi:hypothetical protein